MERQNFDASIQIAGENPEAAAKFLEYMHAAEPELKAAQTTFAQAINAAMQKACESFIIGEKLNLSEEAKNAMTANCGKICKDMCAAGDKMVVEQFAAMSKYMMAAMEK